MGFLEVGVPIPWPDLSSEIKLKVRDDGLRQLLHIWSINEGRHDSELLWGDEQEFTMVRLDHERRRAELVLEAPRILALLTEKEATKRWDPRLVCCKKLFMKKAKATFLRGAEWHPEFGNHMIEATPSPPYSLGVEGLLDIGESMTSRRLKLQEVLTEQFDGVYVCSLTALPNFGVVTKEKKADYIYGLTDEQKSDFLDHSISVVSALPNPHPRFPTLVRSVNRRRGTKVSCLIPIEPGTPVVATSRNSLKEVPKKRELISEQSKYTASPVQGFSYADNFAHGMSMCCLQVTFGAPNLDEALYLYDQMVVLAPIFMAISAATPALFNHISALDTRWKVLQQTCDCRTEEELKTLKQSRFGLAPMFISNDQFLDDHEHWLNDELLPYNERAYELLKRESSTIKGSRSETTSFMSERVMRHFATLWLRDPLVVFSDKIDMDNESRADHFENIQSTNWNTVRFKPPPPSVDGKTPANIGWRVELRTPDLQISDFQNAAIAGVASLLALAILKEHWNFYIPISQVRHNMETAHLKDSCIAQKFWTRLPHTTFNNCTSPVTAQRSLRFIFLDPECGILTKLDKFVSAEWRAQRCSPEAVEQYRIYSAFLRNRVLGKTPTNARELRDLIHRQKVVAKVNCEQSQLSSPISRPDLITTPTAKTPDAESESPRTTVSSPPTAAPQSQPLSALGDCDESEIGHDVNYEIVKHAILTGYFDHGALLASQSVHSTLHSAPRSLHICKQSPVLQSLSKLVSDDFADDLPETFSLCPKSPSRSSSPNEEHSISSESCTDSQPAASQHTRRQLSGCCI